MYFRISCRRHWLTHHINFHLLANRSVKSYPTRSFTVSHIALHTSLCTSSSIHFSDPRNIRTEKVFIYMTKVLHRTTSTYRIHIDCLTHTMWTIYCKHLVLAPCCFILQRVPPLPIGLSTSNALIKLPVTVIIRHDDDGGDAGRFEHSEHVR